MTQAVSYLLFVAGDTDTHQLQSLLTRRPLVLKLSPLHLSALLSQPPQVSTLFSYLLSCWWNKAVVCAEIFYCWNIFRFKLSRRRNL